MIVTSYDPRTGKSNGTAIDSTSQDVAETVAAASEATVAVAAASPRDRRDWLAAVADALEAHADELISLADTETALGEARLAGELARAAGQLRFYGEVAVEGSYLQATIDSASPAGPALARVARPIGPVAVFGASNFPFAFGVLGNDFGSALAAGCPVVVKAHSAHVLLSIRLVEIARRALTLAGAPEGALGVVIGREAGVTLVAADDISAVGFTGSQTGGLALWRVANERDQVIPVYAEMGTVNPVVVTPAASERMTDVAAGFVASYTLGWGQYCTKPGLIFAPCGAQAADAVAQALRAAEPSAVMLTEGIAHAAHDGLSALEAAGATVLVRIDGPDQGWSAPAAVVTAPIDALQPGSALLEEVFGPIAVVVEYDDPQQVPDVLDRLQGSLTASVITALDGPDHLAAELIPRLAEQAGRVTVNDWPTGVAYAWGQHHGGPWPATSIPSATSVGAAALCRFVRPVTFQSCRDEWLPEELRSSNPWRVPRRVDGIMVAPDEGETCHA